MRADLIDKKLYLLYDNELEKEKMYNFIAKMVLGKIPVDFGVLKTINEQGTPGMGLYIKLLIDGHQDYLIDLDKEYASILGGAHVA